MTRNRLYWIIIILCVIATCIFGGMIAADYVAKNKKDESSTPGQAGGIEQTIVTELNTEDKEEKYPTGFADIVVPAAYRKDAIIQDDYFSGLYTTFDFEEMQQWIKDNNSLEGDEKMGMTKQVEKYDKDVGMMTYCWASQPHEDGRVDKKMFLTITDMTGEDGTIRVTNSLAPEDYDCVSDPQILPSAGGDGNTQENKEPADSTSGDMIGPRPE